MDEYLSEKEQVERLRQWWRDNGWYLIGGVVLGALALFGANQFRSHQNRQSEQAGALFDSLKIVAESDDLAEANRLLEQLRKEYPSTAYASQAGLLVAEMSLIAAPERATEELRRVMENTDERELGLIARMRLARALAYREQFDEALAVLEVGEPGRFAGSINEIKGDIYAVTGQPDAARTAYLAALTASGAEVLDRNFLQMKLNDLPSATAANEAAPAPASLPPVEDVAPATPAEPVAAGEPPVAESAVSDESVGAGEPAAAPESAEPAGAEPTESVAENPAPGEEGA